MRKLLVLLLLPIVAFTTMGAASLPDVVKATTTVEVIQEQPAALPVTTQAAAPTAILPDGCTYVGCSTVTPESRDAAYAASLYLPTNRWTDMNYHSRVNWWNPVEASNAEASRAAAGVMMNMGNSVWKLATDWSRMAMDFNPFKSQLGYQIDKVSGVIGKAITGQPVLFALIITFLLVVVLWRAMKRPGTRPFGKLLQSAVVFGLIMMMGTQAAAGTNGEPTDNYKPRAGSPVWIAGAVTGTVDNMASTAVAAVMNGMLPILTDAVGATAPNAWSCSALIEGSFKSANAQAPTAGAEAVSRAMNAMWISTAYNTYAVVQFGDSNPYAREVACRQLERITKADAYTRARMLSQPLYGQMYTVSASNPSATTPFESMTVPMLQDVSDNEANDAAMVAWAACQPNNPRGTSYTVRSGWSDWITSAHCDEAFGATDAEAIKAAGSGGFNIADTDAARAKTDNPAVINFISTLQGRDAGAALGSITSSVIFLIGAVLSGGVFAVMGLAVFASKIFMLLLVAAMFIILVVSLFKNEPMGQTMQQPMFRFLGVTIFAFGSTLLLALLATVALIIAALAGLFGAAGSVGAMLWVSMAPLLAVVAVHFLFTKLFKMPSPVTAKGALAWGTAGGAVGGAVGASLVSRMQNRGASAARMAGRKALGSNKYTSWMVGGAGKSADEARRGAGDAGSRKAATELGGDMHSQELLERSAAEGAARPGAGGAGVGAGGLAAAAAAGAGAALAAKSGPTAEKAAAAEQAAWEATKYLSEDRKKELAADAKRQWREENPGFLATRVAGIKEKLAARQDARAAILGESLNTADNADEESLLSPSARGKVGLINRPSLDSFMLAPGEAAAPMVSAIPAAKWRDLSPEGKLEATKLAAARDREMRAAAKVERARQADVRRDARAAARAELPPLTDRAKAAVKAGVTNVGNAGSKAGSVASAAWTEAKTKSLEFRSDPQGMALGAANASLDAARKAGYATVQGAAKAREVAGKAKAATSEGKGRAVATAGAAVAGGVLLAAGNPVVGAVVVGTAAAKGIGQARGRSAARKLAKQTYMNEIIAARATARKMAKPGTSIVSDAAPVKRGDSMI